MNQFRTRGNQERPMFLLAVTAVALICTPLGAVDPLPDPEPVEAPPEASPPVLTMPTEIAGAAGFPFSLTITATGNPAPAIFIAPSLFAAMVGQASSENTTSAVIQIFAPTTGAFILPVAASNTQGTDLESLLVIIEGPPFILTPPSAIAFVNTFFTQNIAVVGFLPVTFSASPLPPGMNFDNGVISGTANAEGSFAVTITATNAAGTASQNLVISIERPQSAGTLPNIGIQEIGEPQALPPQPLGVSRMSVGLNFAAAARDSMKLSGRLIAAQPIVVAGETVVMNIGGIVETFVIDRRGIGVAGDNRIKMRASRGLQHITFSATFSNENLREAVPRFFEDADVQEKTGIVPVSLLLANSIYQAEVEQTYSAQRGKFGRSRMR